MGLLVYMYEPDEKTIFLKRTAYVDKLPASILVFNFV